MAKSVSERSADWRRRLLLKSSIFDDLNAERAARIRQAFPGDERPEVRAVVEFFANYPRCQISPHDIYMVKEMWIVSMRTPKASFEAAAAACALEEVTSLPVHVVFQTQPIAVAPLIDQVRDEVAEMRALGLWGRS